MRFSKVLKNLLNLKQTNSDINLKTTTAQRINPHKVGDSKKVKDIKASQLTASNQKGDATQVSDQATTNSNVKAHSPENINRDLDSLQQLKSQVSSSIKIQDLEKDVFEHSQTHTKQDKNFEKTVFSVFDESGRSSQSTINALEASTSLEIETEVTKADLVNKVLHPQSHYDQQQQDLIAEFDHMNQQLDQALSRKTSKSGISTKDTVPSDPIKATQTVQTVQTTETAEIKQTHILEGNNTNDISDLTGSSKLVNSNSDLDTTVTASANTSPVINPNSDQIQVIATEELSSGLIKKVLFNPKSNKTYSIFVKKKDDKLASIKTSHESSSPVPASSSVATASSSAVSTSSSAATTSSSSVVATTNQSAELTSRASTQIPDETKFTASPQSTDVTITNVVSNDSKEEDVKLEDITSNKSQLEDAKFSNSKLGESKLEDSKLSNSKLKYIKLKDTTRNASELADSNMSQSRSSKTNKSSKSKPYVYGAKQYVTNSSSDASELNTPANTTSTATNSTKTSSNFTSKSKDTATSSSFADLFEHQDLSSVVTTTKAQTDFAHIFEQNQSEFEVKDYLKEQDLLKQQQTQQSLQQQKASKREKRSKMFLPGQADPAESKCPALADHTFYDDNGVHHTNPRVFNLEQHLLNDDEDLHSYIGSDPTITFEQELAQFGTEEFEDIDYDVYQQSLDQINKADQALAKSKSTASRLSTLSPNSATSSSSVATTAKASKSTNTKSVDDMSFEELMSGGFGLGQVPTKADDTITSSKSNSTYNSNKSKPATSSSLNRLVNQTNAKVDSVVETTANSFATAFEGNENSSKPRSKKALKAYVYGKKAQSSTQDHSSAQSLSHNSTLTKHQDQESFAQAFNHTAFNGKYIEQDQDFDWRQAVGNINRGQINTASSLSQQALRAERKSRIDHAIPSKKDILMKQIEQQDRAAAEFKAGDFISDINMVFTEHNYKEARFIRSDLDTNVATMFRKSMFDVQLLVDLHGMTREEAKETIKMAINSAKKNNEYTILFMTGHGKQILKQSVPNWLIQHSFVVAFKPARDVSDTNGFVVLLKNYSKEDKFVE